MRGRGRRWWSVYLADGTRLEDVRMTARDARATLIGAIVDGRVGRITIPGAGAPAGAVGAGRNEAKVVEVDTE